MPVAASYRGRSHAELARLIEEPVAQERAGADGVVYQVEIEAFWRDKPGGELRLVFGVDDGGARAYVPLTQNALVAPTGVFDAKLS